MSSAGNSGRGPGVRPPHPATVAQPKVPHPATVAQPKVPHPATVAQPKVPLAATIVQGKGLLLRPATGVHARPPGLSPVIQRAALDTSAAPGSGSSPLPANPEKNPVRDRLIGLSAHANLISDLAKHLLMAIDAIDTGNWTEVAKLLRDTKLAKAAGYTIRPAGYRACKDVKEAAQAIGRAMHVVGKKLELPEVCISPSGTQSIETEKIAKAPENDKDLAWVVYPVWLEEWIHMFQYKAHCYLSDGTYAFEESSEAEGKRWSMNEVDIYATYKDLGWYRVLEAFRNRYEERQKYEEFDQLRRAKIESPWTKGVPSVSPGSALLGQR